MASKATPPPAAPVEASRSTKTAAPTTRTVQVTPDTSLNKRMSVDKNIVDELLLVCGVLGTTDDETGKLVPVEDCLNWLQDLQRALRRDDDLYRPISLLLGQWKVVQQKLLPLVLSCRYDTAMVLTICKILVILTKPLSENTVRAGRMVIDTKKTNENVVKEQIKLRENALQQAQNLMEHKRAFCQHPSHVGPQKQQGGVLSVFVSLLAEPLSKQGTSRTDSDHLTIELVLHLLRNLLSAEPLLHTSTDSVHRSQQIHHEFIALLESEFVLDVLLVLGAELEQRENAQYNLLVMELLHHMLRNQDPTAVARSSFQTGSNNSKTTPGVRSQGLLKSQLNREKQSLTVATSSRHSHFGGTLTLKQRPGARRQYVSTSNLVQPEAAGVAAPRRKNKKTDPFIGAMGNLQIHKRGKEVYGQAAARAHKTLDAFCQRFVKDCYGPVMKSLKNEFRRDSVRLEDGDRVVFFRLVWFFTQWWRAGGRKTMASIVSTKSPSNEDDSSSDGILGQLIFTMDLFTFKLVLNATDTFQQHKKYARLAQSVALLSEMMHLLHVMYQSKESTEQLMAMGLMDRLFFGSEPLDRLPKLLSKWAPGTCTREYLCDLVEVCHMTLKLLDEHTKTCDDVTTNTTTKKKSKDNTPQDTIAKMKAAAADFDATAYFARKLVSNHTVQIYTQILSQYAINAPQVNHRVITFFLRLCKVKIAVADEADPSVPKNLLATKTVTLEPMLYNVHLLSVLNTILNDSSIRKDKDYTTTLSFASGIVHDFALASNANPMLFVEALLKHPVPHRFCEFSTNMYVSEELRMLAERELLLEEQERYERQVEAAAQESSDDDEEEELMFEDFGVTSASKRSGKTTGKADAGVEASATGKAVDDSSESDHDDQVGSRKDDGGRIALTRLRKRAVMDSSDEDEDVFGVNLGSRASKRSNMTTEIADEEMEATAMVVENTSSIESDHKISAIAESDRAGLEKENEGWVGGLSRMRKHSDTESSDEDEDAFEDNLGSRVSKSSDNTNRKVDEDDNQGMGASERSNKTTEKADEEMEASVTDKAVDDAHSTESDRGDVRAGENERGGDRGDVRAGENERGGSGKDEEGRAGGLSRIRKRSAAESSDEEEVALDGNLVGSNQGFRTSPESKRSRKVLSDNEDDV